MKTGMSVAERIFHHKNFVPVLFFVSGLVVLAISLIANRMIDRTVKLMEDATQHRLLNAATSAALYVSAEELDLYHEAEDIARPEYEALRERLIDFAERYHVLYVYYWRDYGDGRIQYIVDNDLDPENQMTPANFFELEDMARETLSGVRTTTNLGEYTPSWDGLISAFAPVYDDAGNIYCIAGVDISDEFLLTQRGDTFLLNTLYFGAFIITMIIGTISMILYRRNAIKSELASAAKSTFLAKTSHEIRTPMNAILGMTELLLRREIPPEAVEDAMSIKQAGINLLSIINDILDFSKIESGKLDIVPVDYLLASVINDCINIIRMRLTDKPILFLVHADSALPSGLRGDEVRLRQILINLLSNAVKYTREGSITLSVTGKEIKGADAAGKRFLLVFMVTDTGIGIRNEDMGRLFGEFQQFDTQQNLGIEGTGLGLAISRNLCRLMGGDINVSSVYGQGSSFTASVIQELKESAPIAAVVRGETKKTLVYTIRQNYRDSIIGSLKNLGVPVTVVAGLEDLSRELQKGSYAFALVSTVVIQKVLDLIRTLNLSTHPVLLADMGELITFQDIPVINMPAYTIPIANVLNGMGTPVYQKKTAVRFIAPSAKILVVDDIVTNLNVAKGLLALYQTDITVCTTGVDAIRLVQENRYDIVFMDHMMPGMDGIEAAKRIRALGDAYKKLTIIILTANAVSGMREMFLAEGFNDYLSKPIEIVKLDELIAKWIPPEKQTKTGGLIKRENFSGDAGISIPGVDARKGINMTGGTLAGYRKVLAQFYQDASERLPALAEVPAEKDLAAFTAQAHAIKSAAGTIGAAEVSAEAVALETAGKAGNMITIRNILPGFYEELSELVKVIGEALSDGRERAEGKGEQQESVLMPAVRPLLASLKAGLEAKDMKEIDKLIEELEGMSLDGKSRENINAISDKVLMGEYQEAIENINAILEEET
jgi:signal transduction histidine kinase/CheY-like chemotaxis protein